MREAGHDGGAQPPFSGDELIGIADAPHDQRREHAEFGDAVRQLAQLVQFKNLARLERVGADVADGDMKDLLALIVRTVARFSLGELFLRVSKASHDAVPPSKA